VIHFTHKIESLGTVLESLDVDTYAKDELESIDFEQYLYHQDIVFAVLLEEEAAAMWSLLEASEVENITDDFYRCECDELPILCFDAKIQAFFFVRTKFIEEADALINSLL
jgi:hypothetical protein